LRISGTASAPDPTFQSPLKKKSAEEGHRACGFGWSSADINLSQKLAWGVFVRGAEMTMGTKMDLLS
jgi:hypothetical protein